MAENGPFGTTFLTPQIPRKVNVGPLAYEQRRVDLATFRAVPASTCGHCPQALCFTTVWDTPGKEKIAKWSSAPASILEGFNESCVVYGPEKPYKTGEKRQSCQIDPCLPPYWVPFLSSSQEMRHINFFLGAQNGGSWVGAKKLMLKKLLCLFRPLAELVDLSESPFESLFRHFLRGPISRDMLHTSEGT